MENIKSNKLFCCTVAVVMGVCSNLYGSDHAPDPFALGAPAHRLAPGHTMTDKEVIDFATARIAEIEAQIPLWQQMLDEEKYDELGEKVAEMFTYARNLGNINLSVNSDKFVKTRAGEQKNAIALLNVLYYIHCDLASIKLLMSKNFEKYAISGKTESNGLKSRNIPDARKILENLQNRYYIIVTDGLGSKTRSPYAEVAFPLVDSYVEKRLADGAHGTTAATPAPHNEDDE